MRHQPTLKTDAMMAIIKVSEFFFLLEDMLCVVIHLGPVVQSPISVNPWLNFNPGSLFLCSRAFSGQFPLILLGHPIIKLCTKKFE